MDLKIIMSLQDKIITILRVVFIASVIGGSYYQYKSNVIKESIDGLVDISDSLEKKGFLKGVGVWVIKMFPQTIRDKLGYYLFSLDFILMMGSLFFSQRLLIIFGVRYLIQEVLRSDLLSFSLKNVHFFTHLALGLGVCGVSFYLS